MIRVVFVNRFFYPDHSATSQMLSDLAFSLARDQFEVTVVTSRQRYDDPSSSLAAREQVNGVDIWRIWTTRFGRAWLPGRAMDYLSFYLSCAWRLWRLAKDADVVVAKTDPPMLSIIVQPICRLRGAKMVNWLQDLFPEVAQALGVSRLNGILGRSLIKARNRSLLRSDMNIAIGHRMQQKLIDVGVDPSRLKVIQNWADGTRLVPVPHDANELRKEWALSGKLVVGYSGNMGRGHPFEAVLEAAEELRSAAVVWLLIGGGPRRDWLQSEVKARDLQDTVLFKPYQPRDSLALSLGACDVHLVSLQSTLEGLMVPSKFYGVAAVGRATIFLGDADGEVAKELAKFGSGVSVRPDDGQGLARTIEDLINSPLRVDRMGRNARKAFDDHYSFESAAHRWQSALRIVNRGAASNLNQEIEKSKPR